MIQIEEIPITNDLVLIGGGHSHLSVLMKLSKKPLNGNRITLITNEIDTPYSGMIPGYIEGIYSWRDSHIDLYRLCLKLNVRFIHAEVERVSAYEKEIYFKDRPKIKFDVLSINTGIQSNNREIKGAAKYCLPVKPISKLTNNFLNKITNFKSIAFIGGGAGSVELALAIKKRFLNINQDIKITIITGKRGLLSTFPQKTKLTSLKTLEKFKIDIIEYKRVLEVKPKQIILSDKSMLKIDKAILSTNSMTPKWLAKSDILLTKDNYILVNKSFQTNYKYVFASGDVIDFNNQNLKKAGVFAVRSGKPLAINIRKFILGKKLVEYKFNKNYLALIGTSKRSAIATKYNLTFNSRFFFYLKKYIDQNFIKKFSDFRIRKKFTLDALKTDVLNIFVKHKEKITDENDIMQCKGCAAKVPLNALKQALPKDIVSTSEDAVSVPGHPELYQTVDMISSIITDPFLLGKIAANHSISDMVSVNSKITSAMMILQLPLSKTEINSRDLEQVLLGANEIFKTIDCPLIGGHTMIGKDKDPIIGFSILGQKQKKIKIVKNRRKIKTKDLLILTEKIGSGLIFAGINNYLIDSYFQIDVIKQMIKGNLNFGKISNQLNILSMTDITGFGLANHLLNLIKRDNSKTGLTIYPNKIPLFEGVNECLNKDIKSSLFKSNYDIAQKDIIYKRDKSKLDNILYDPQTVGGIAFIIPQEEKYKHFKVLKENNIKFTEIGFVNNIENKIAIN
jgi:selenide,water dikinase